MFNFAIIDHRLHLHHPSLVLIIHFIVILLIRHQQTLAKKKKKTVIIGSWMILFNIQNNLKMLVILRVLNDIIPNPDSKVYPSNLKFQI